MRPLLNVLDELSYSFENLALDYTGEAKATLSALCRGLESDPQFDIVNKEFIAAEIMAARKELVGGDKAACASALCRISRALWDVARQESLHSS